MLPDMLGAMAKAALSRTWPLPAESTAAFSHPWVLPGAAASGTIAGGTPPLALPRRRSRRDPDAIPVRLALITARSLLTLRAP